MGVIIENGEVFSRLDVDPEKLRQTKNRTPPDLTTDQFKKRVIEGRDQYGQIVDTEPLEILKADPFEKSVIEERDLLTDKVVALADFMVNNPAFLSLPAEEQNFLRRHLALMRAYKQVLDEPIFNFTL